MVVHRLGAGQQTLETVHPNRQRNRQAHRRPQGITPAHPVPHAEHVGSRQAENLRLLRRRRHRHKVQRQSPRRIIPRRRAQPLPRRMRVEHGLLRRESLARHNEQRGARIQGIQQLGHVCTVHIGHEVHLQPLALISRQRPHHRLRPQIRPADPDIHHIANRLTGKATPQPTTHLLGELAHLRTHCTHFRHHVAGARWEHTRLHVAQSRMENSTVFADVDLVAGE